MNYKKVLYTIFIDATAILIIYFIAKFTFAYLGSWAGTLSGGSLDFQKYLLSMSQQQLESYYAQLRGFAIVFIAALILMPILSLMLYSLGQSYIWMIIKEKKVNLDFFISAIFYILAVIFFPLSILIYLLMYFLYKKKHYFENSFPLISKYLHSEYWKWNVLNLLIIICFTILLVLLSIISSAIKIPLLSALVIIASLSAFILLSLNIQRNFAATYSLLKTFEGLNFNWKTYGYAFIALVVIQLVQYPLAGYYITHQNTALIIQAVLFLLYIGCLRLYIAEDEKHLAHVHQDNKLHLHTNPTKTAQFGK